MPSTTDHIAKAERYERFAETLGKTDYLDWAVTVLYYAALHYMDAVLAVSQAHPQKHRERHPLIQTNATLRRVYGEYRTLETLSWNARYLALPIEPNDWQAAKLAFDPLRAHIRNHLGLH